MSTDFLKAIIDNIESKEDLNIQLKGIHIWPIIRIQIRKNLRLISVKEANQFSKIHYDRFSIRLFLKSFYSILRIRNFKSDVLILTNITSKKIKVDSKWYDVYFDSLLSHLKEKKVSYTKLSYSLNKRQAVPEFYKSVEIDSLIYLSFILAKFAKKVVPLPTNFENFITKINEEISTLDYNSTVFIKSKNVSENILRIYFLSIFFNILLKRIKPKLVLTTSYYGLERALVYSSKRRSIPCYDVQHGLQGEDHPAYNYWNKYPPAGYNVVPDYYINWIGTDSVKVPWIEGNNSENLKIFNPTFASYLMYEKMIYNSIPELEEKNKMNVLITLQSGELLDKVIIEIIEKNPNRCKFFVRRHPSMKSYDFNHVKSLLDNFNNCEFEIASSTQLYRLFIDIDIHITSFSVTAIESANLEIPTIITNSTYLKYFTNEINDGRIKFFQNSQDINLYLKQISKSSRNSRLELYKKLKAESEKSIRDLTQNLINIHSLT